MNLALIALAAVSGVSAQEQEPSNRVSDRYAKYEYRIPMRDGVKLYVAVYVPKLVPGKHPILVERTPYGAGPYGPNNYMWVGNDPHYRDAGYIQAFADVRGQYMSEGTYVNVRPQLQRGQKGIDESTDTYDTIDYLVKHVPNNNGSVGLTGISYPGFYAGAGAINNHPALKAVSPQAPVSDWFQGDDVHHNGAFFLQDNLDFSAWFDYPRKGLEKGHGGLTIPREGKSAYDFFLEAGNAQGLEDKYLKGSVPYWNELIQHPNYDAYWKDRSLPAQMKNVGCAVLTVGGWFDAEDMWGALNLFAATKKQNPRSPVFLVMGPWFHGMWAYGDGQTFGDLNYGMPTSKWFRDNVEFPFFEHYLRGQSNPEPAVATVFQTGANKWRTFPQWPPRGLGHVRYFLEPSKTLAEVKPTEDGSDSYVNDPAKPTPYVANFATSTRRPTTYMVADQRFAEGRPDVLTYKSASLSKDLTVAGPIDADFWIKSTGTDADLVVKVIDVWPSDSTEKGGANVDSMANYEQLLRADVMRVRFRDSFEEPKPIAPGQPTHVRFKLNDVLHTFKVGHHLMVQVQSSWFPLVDRNPNRFVDVATAKPTDFQSATITVLRDRGHASSVEFGTLPQ